MAHFMLIAEDHRTKLLTQVVIVAQPDGQEQPSRIGGRKDTIDLRCWGRYYT